MRGSEKQARHHDHSEHVWIVRGKRIVRCAEMADATLLLDVPSPYVDRLTRFTSLTLNAPRSVTSNSKDTQSNVLAHMRHRQPALGCETWRRAMRDSLALVCASYLTRPEAEPRLYGYGF
jgi:hypothetical protein